MNKVKSLVKSGAVKAKNHVKRNAVAYGISAVAVAAVALQQANAKAFYRFLEEKGIDPQEYYCPEAYAEKSV